MNKYIFIIILFFINSSSFSQYFGGKKNDTGISFCHNKQHFFLTGTTRSFSEKSDDIWIIKVNNELKDVFNIKWDSVNFDIPADIISTSDNKYLLTGYSWDAPGGRSDIVLLKLDESGNTIWTSFFGGVHNDYVYSVKETIDRGYLITGIDRSQGEMGAVFLIKTNELGILQWKKYYDTDNKDIGMDVVECIDSSLLILANTNSFIGKISNSSEYISDEASKIILIKTDKYGNELWRKFYGGEKHDFSKKIVSNGDNKYYFIGSSLNNTNGSFDITLHKIDSAGNIIWRKNYGGTGYEYGNYIDINENGDLLLTGTSSSFSENNDPDIYVVKVNENGEQIWSETYGGLDSDYGNCGQFLNDDSIAILGSSKSGNGDDLDLFFVKLSASGEIIKTLNNELTNDDVNPIIYPNPTNNYINIHMGDNVGIKQFDFFLYNISGILIKENTYFGSLSTIQFDSNFTKGVYIYHIKSEDSTHKGKIIIY